MRYYKIIVKNGSNSNQPLVSLQETNSGGTLLAANGDNFMFTGDFDFKYKTKTDTIEFYSNNRKHISLKYENIRGYNILLTTTGLDNMHAIWDQIALIASTAF